VRFQRITGHISEMMKMRPRLLLITNRKWRISFQMTWKSSTLDDLEGHWKSVQLAILATAGFLVFIIYQLVHKNWTCMLNEDQAILEFWKWLAMTDAVTYCYYDYNNNWPVILVTPPSAAAAPTIAYSPGVTHVCPPLHISANIPYDW